MNCDKTAVALLTFSPPDAKAWLYDLHRPDPAGGIMLCRKHANATVVPMSWQLVDSRDPAWPGQVDAPPAVEVVAATSAEELVGPPRQPEPMAEAESDTSATISPQAPIDTAAMRAARGTSSEVHASAVRGATSATSTASRRTTEAFAHQPAVRRPSSTLVDELSAIGRNLADRSSSNAAAADPAPVAQTRPIEEDGPAVSAEVAPAPAEELVDAGVRGVRKPDPSLFELALSDVPNGSSSPRFSG